MSEFVALRRVKAVYEHPNADKLAVVKVGEFTVIHNKEEAEKLKVGQAVVHFPTDICIDPEKAVELGVANYLRRAKYKNNGESVPCRIIAARLRGVPSYGFINMDTSIPDDKLDEHYGVWKYEPPAIPLHLGGEVEREEHPQFPMYTKIKRIQLFPEHWKEGTPVRVTEKLHGTNVRLGMVKVNDEWQFMVGNRTRILRQFNKEGEENKYWKMLTGPIMLLLNTLCDGELPVVVYGEMFGSGIQDLDYGFEEPVLRVFDIMVGGLYQNWETVLKYCTKYRVATVPLLHTGPFSWSIPEHFTDGNSVVNHPSFYKSQFKGREGVVITPLEEQFNPLGGRLIAKSISVDYEQRRNGTEYH